MPHVPTPPFPSLVELLRWRAAQQPRQLGYTFLPDGESAAHDWTWLELHDRAAAVARWLDAHDARGLPVLLLFDEGLDYLAALFGCMFAGALAVPVHPPDPARLHRTVPRLRAICADADVRLVLTHRPQRAVIPRIHQAVPGLSRLPTCEVDALPSEPPADLPLPSPDDLAYLQYTSGSTATPRGVRITHRNLTHQLADFNTGYGHTPHSVIVTWLPATHDLGLVYGRLMSLFVGCRCVFLPPTAFLQRPARWMQAIHRFRGTHTASPNFGYDLVARKVAPEALHGLDLSCLEVALNGAEAIRQDTERRFVRALRPAGLRPQALTHAMGMSEATAKVVTEPTDRLAQFLHLAPTPFAGGKVVPVPEGTPGALTIASCGRPLTDTRVAIVDPGSRTPLPDDRVGELWVAGTTVADGYHRQPDATGQTFQAHTADGEGPWLRTGDLAFTHRGEVYLTGRLKDLVILRGQNHHPQDLEWTVQDAHPALRPGCIAAFAVPHEEGEGLGLVAEVRPEDLEPDAVFAAIREALGAHGLAPACLGLLPPRALPKTTSGKLQRRRTQQALLDGDLPLLARWDAPARSAQPPPAPSPALRARLDRASPRRRHALLVSHLAQVAASLLGVDADDLDLDEPLQALGLDSVTAVEMVERVGRDLGLSLSGTVLFDHPTLEALGRYLNERLTP